MHEPLSLVFNPVSYVEKRSSTATALRCPLLLYGYVKYTYIGTRIIFMIQHTVRTDRRICTQPCDHSRYIQVPITFTYTSNVIGIGRH